MTTIAASLYNWTEASYHSLHGDPFDPFTRCQLCVAQRVVVTIVIYRRSHLGRTPNFYNDIPQLDIPPSPLMNTCVRISSPTWLGSLQICGRV
jgi:hypothetical protein